MEYNLLKLTSDNFTSIPNINLSDNVIIFSIDDNWIVYPLKYFICKPMIRYKTYTLIGCVISLKVILVEAEVKFYSYKNDKLLLQYNNIVFDMDTIPVDIKRSQCKIQSLRSALILVGDISYIDINPKLLTTPVIRSSYYDILDLNDFQNEPILDLKLELEFNPKTLCTIIAYVSKSNNIKYTILVGKNDKDHELWGYEPKKNKIDFYLEKMTDKIIQKEAFIFNMLYYMAVLTYEDARIIHIEN
jgi:hypothetical protein